MELTVPLWPRWHIPLGTASPLEKKCSHPCKNNIRDGVNSRKQKLTENAFNYSIAMAGRVTAARTAPGTCQGCGFTSTGRVLSRDAPSPPNHRAAHEEVTLPSHQHHARSSIPTQNPPWGFLKPTGFQEPFNKMSSSPMDHPPRTPHAATPSTRGLELVPLRRDEPSLPLYLTEPGSLKPKLNKNKGKRPQGREPGGRTSARPGRNPQKPGQENKQRLLGKVQQGCDPSGASSERPHGGRGREASRGVPAAGP